VTELLDQVDDLHREALPRLFRKVAEPRSRAFFDEFVSKPDRAMFLASTPAGAVAGALLLFLRQPARTPIVERTTIAEIDTLVVRGPSGRQWDFRRSRDGLSHTVR
jgi:hypothetical protein